jgi:hypothetical protein
MRFIFLATLTWLDPSTHAYIHRHVAEFHSSLESCINAQKELLALGKVRGVCVPAAYELYRATPSTRQNSRFRPRKFLSLYLPGSDQSGRGVKFGASGAIVEGGQ